MIEIVEPGPPGKGMIVPDKAVPGRSGLCRAKPFSCRPDLASAFLDEAEPAPLSAPGEFEQVARRFDLAGKFPLSERISKSFAGEDSKAP